MVLVTVPWYLYYSFRVTKDQLTSPFDIVISVETVTPTSSLFVSGLCPTRRIESFAARSPRASATRTGLFILILPTIFAYNFSFSFRIRSFEERSLSNLLGEMKSVRRIETASEQGGFTRVLKLATCLFTRLHRRIFLLLWTGENFPS